MNLNSIQSKACKRKHYLAIRQRENASIQKQIFHEVIKSLSKRLEKLNSSKHIGIYWPLSGEIDITRLKEIIPSPIALPAITGKRLITYHSWDTNSLQKDLMGIPAPINRRKLHSSEIEILLVPAISIDKSGYRLGYGGGYYDQLRSDHNWRSITSLIVIPSSCISPTSLPRDPWDIPFDGAITENGEQTFIID